MEDRSALTIIKAAIKNPISRPITLMEVIRKITNISSTHKAVNSSDRAVATCNTDRWRAVINITIDRTTDSNSSTQEMGIRRTRCTENNIKEVGTASRVATMIIMGNNKTITGVARDTLSLITIRGTPTMIMDSNREDKALEKIGVARWAATRKINTSDISMTIAIKLKTTKILTRPRILILISNIKLRRKMLLLNPSHPKQM